MALTEAEKRQKLRERRAAKIKNGATRLGKITGDYSEASKESSTSPEPNATSPSSSVNAASNASSSSSAATKANNRISQSFDNDPEIEDISKFEPVKESKNEDDTELSSDAQQFEQMLQQMLSSPNHHSTAGSSDGFPLGGTDGSAGSQFDIFSQLLSGQGLPGTGDAGGEPPKSNEGNEYEAQLCEYNKIINDKYKAKFMLIKLFITSLITIWFFHFKGFHSSSYEVFRIKGIESGFTKIWISFEVIFTSIYALHLNKIEDRHYNYNSKILNLLGMVPEMFVPLHIKNKIRWFVKYLELLNLIIFDLSVVVFIYGILSFLHRIQI